MEPQLQSSALPAEPMPESGWRGFGRGLIPLLVLVACLVTTLVLTFAARLLTNGVDFSIQQWIVLAVLVIGLVIAAVAYIIALVGAFRLWRREENDTSATGMLWALIVTAVIVVLPIVVAALVPQNPAP